MAIQLLLNIGVIVYVSIVSLAIIESLCKLEVKVTKLETDITLLQLAIKRELSRNNANDSTVDLDKHD